MRLSFSEINRQIPTIQSGKVRLKRASWTFSTLRTPNHSRSLAFLHYPISLAPFPVEHGGSIASERGGEHMYVEGRVLTTKGEPIACAIMDI